MLKTTLMVVAMGVACLALAQEPPPLPGGGFQGGPPPAGPRDGGMQARPGMGLMGPRILMRADVQRELKLTAEQKRRLGELMPPMRFGGPGLGPPPPGRGGAGGDGPGQLGGGQLGGGQLGGGPPPPGRPPLQNDPDRDGPRPDRPGPDLERKIKEILTNDQYRRYQELSLQLQGGPAVMRPGIADRLGLTEEQRASIQKILRDHRPPPGPPAQLGGAPPPQPPDREAMRERRRELESKIMAVLTGAQKEQWKSMLGKPFDFQDPPHPGPGGPPPGRPPLGGGGGG